MKVVHLLRKPCSESTVAANVLRWGTGALNIDATRIGYESGEVDFDRVQRQQHSEGAVTGAFGAASLIGKAIPTYKPTGRWPANLVLQHLDGCVQDGTRKVKGQNPQYASDGKGETGLHVYNRNNRSWGTRPARTGIGHADPDGNETVAAWACAEGCPVAGIDQQSGDLPVSRGGGNGYACSIFGTNTSSNREKGVVGFGDSGGASRFFKQVKA